MTDSIFNRLASRVDETSARRGDETETTEDFQSFGWLRGIRDRALMLELRFRNGNIVSLGYPWLERAEFDPSEGIVLQFGGRSIRITGNHLNSEIRPSIRLFAGIVRHRVTWIQESEFGLKTQSDKKGLFVEAIRED
jgi:hypothetical protein